MLFRSVGGSMALCAYSTPFEFVSFWPSHHFCCLCIGLILLYVLVDVYLLWRKGCMGFWAHIFFLYPFLDLVLLWQKPSSSCWALLFFSMTLSLLATDLAISLHCVCYNFTSLFISYYPMGLWADVTAVSTHFFINLLLKVSLVHLPHLYFFWAC